MEYAVSGSSGSYPTMMSSNFARSVTVRAMGPKEPWTDGHPAYTPPRLTRPAVGRIPTMQFQVAGRRMDADAQDDQAQQRQRHGADEE